MGSKTRAPHHEPGLRPQASQLSGLRGEWASGRSVEGHGIKSPRKPLALQSGGPAV